jgi:hypothetical protein
MESSREAKADGLYEIVDQKVTALIREIEEAGWRSDEITLALRDVLKTRWLGQADALRDVRESMPKNFISDGNEG